MMSSEEARRLAAAEIISLLDEPGRVMVGITGPPGAGKSFFAERVADDLGASYLPMDGFHLSNKQLDRLGRRDRKGAVDTFDVAGYIDVLERVIREHVRSDVYVPDFDRRIDEPVAAGRVVPADVRVVVTEGNYLALPSDGWRPVRALLDKLYYVDCPISVRRTRLIARHVAGGRSRVAAERWVDDVDEPNARLIETTRDGCDRVFWIGDPGQSST